MDRRLGNIDLINDHRSATLRKFWKQFSCFVAHAIVEPLEKPDTIISCLYMEIQSTIKHSTQDDGRYLNQRHEYSWKLLVPATVILLTVVDIIFILMFFVFRLISKETLAHYSC